MTDQNRAVDPNTIPEGWTDRMRTVDGPEDSLPSYAGLQAGGGKGGQENAAPAASGEDGGQAEPQSNEGKYWRDETMALRERVDQLLPLEKYGSLIEYLDRNPDAANLVIDHMNGIRGEAGTPQGELERELYGENDTNNATQQVASQEPARRVDDANVQSRKHMYNEIQRLMQEQGIPSHEADQHLKFMLTPGEISPQEMLDMYRALSASRGRPLGGNPQGQESQNNTQPQGTANEPAKEVFAGKNELPPPSVAGVGGANANPNNMPQKSSAQDRLAYDPNNA